MTDRTADGVRPLPTCVGRESRGIPCAAKVVPRCPVPLCIRHLAYVFEFICEQRDAKVGRETVPVDTHLAKAAFEAFPGRVYYVRVGQLIKIGHSRDLASRLRIYPPDAELLASEPGDASLETQRHAQFTHLLSHRREWFRMAPELMEHIAERPSVPKESEPVDGDYGYTLKDAARVTGVSLGTLSRWVRQGRLTITTKGRRRRISLLDVAELAKHRPKMGAPPRS